MSRKTGLEIEVAQGPNIATYPPGASFGPRHLKDYEFVWLLEGDAEYSYVDQGRRTTVAAPQGSLILCRSGFLDTFTWDRKKRTRHGFFHFKLVHAGEHWPAPEQWPVLRSMEPTDLYLPLTRHILTWGDEGNSAQRDLVAGLFLSLFLTGESRLAEFAARQSPDPVERALSYMYERLEADASAPLSLDQLATAAFVSPEHLCRVFKSATGRSPLETVRLARLDRAALLLSHTNYGVAQVAAMTGFASPFHFSRSFKAAYGLSPRALQQIVAAGELPPLPRLLATGRA